MKKLNFGCGDNILEGYVNLDINKRDGVDVIWDLNEFPYPFGDGEFDEVLAESVLEHVGNADCVVQELYRIIKPGGKLIINVPYYLSFQAWKHPQHKRTFNSYTFDFYVKNNDLRKDYSFGFSKISKRLIFPGGMDVFARLLGPLMNKMIYLYETTLLRFLIPAMSVKVELTK